MAVPIRLIVFLLCLCLLTLVFSFNLEPRIPIVKNGTPGSHFGYTVAQHQTILDTASGSEYKKSWILVGAPKDHNLQPGTNRSGALWKCPLTTNISDCQQVYTDGFKNPETGLYNFDYVDETLSQPAEDEIKDGQWLGVTLKSQGPGGKVLVCAHRYMSKGKGFQWGFGLCYILSQTLDVNDYLEPCRGKPVDEGHQQYGFCQAGTSGLLLDDEAVLGVPGPYTWRGTVHTSNISDDFLLKDKTQYFGPVTANNSPVDKYSYLGYSVTAGHFFGSYMSYVGGAPRANGTGQIVFFSREKIGNSLLRVDLILSGEMFASSYGFEVLAIDINGDGRDDLVVGAPFYHSRTASGAVYIYMNNDGGFTPNHPYTKIEGSAGETRFGFSMTSLGDLNHDGYMDVAIGAPYEGRGAIYIYLGSDNGLIKDPSQVILSEEIPGVSYNAFGYSLSGGMDLDGNGYPDLLTSSFCSDRVLLIRARPIIDIQTQIQSHGQLQNIDPSRKGCTEDMGSSETCFSFDACFKMDNDAGTKTDLRLKYTIEEKLYKDRPIPRVRFADGLQDQPSILHRYINLRPEDMGIYQCSREIVYLLDGPRDILRPLKFKLSYVIIQKEPRPVAAGDPVPDIDDYPILNQQEAVRYFDGTFAKDCGDDDICVSDLNVTGSLDLEQHESQLHYLLRLGEQDTVPLNIEVTNTGEPAYESTLLITHHKALAFNLKESQIGAYQCSLTSPTVVQCGIGNPLTDTTGPLILSFRESGHPFDSRFIHFTVAANSSSTEETPQEPLHFHVEVIKRAEISIIGSVTPEQAFYGGEVVGESAIKHLEEVGVEVTHKYVIDNRGPWRVNELEVEVLWPHQVENNKEQGKWLLYMTDQPSVDGIGECEVDSRLINPLILRRQQVSSTDTLTGIEVEGEQETPDYPVPGGEAPDETEDRGEVGTSAGGVKITKTTTKKVTNTTTIKKKTSKTTSEKDFSVSTERTSSSSGFSSSSSSSSFSSSSSSSSGFSESDSHPSVDEQEGSGFNEPGVREHGRTHLRVSRRVYSSSGGSKFVDSNIGINNIDNDRDEDGTVVSHHEETRTSLDNDGDEDGTVVSHHEETRTSFGTSPDGKSKFHETHHKSKKVTVKEEVTEEEIPQGRWSDGGGYRRTYTETSSSGVRTSDSVPEGDRFQWEDDGTSHTGEGALYDSDLGGDTDELERSRSSDGSDRREQDWRLESSGHSSKSVNRGETIRRTHSESFGGTGGDDHYRRIYEETKTFDGDSGTQTSGYGTTLDREGGRRVHVYGGRTGTGIDRSGWPDESDRREDWRVESGTHRVENVNRAQATGRTGEGDFTGTHTYESRGRYGNGFKSADVDMNDRRISSGVQRTYTDSYGRTSGHRSSPTDVDYDQNVDSDSFTTDSGDYDSISRVHSSGSDRVTADNEGRTNHGHDRNLDENGYKRTVFDWGDKGTGTGSHTGHSRGHKRTEIIRTTDSSGYRRTDQDKNVQHSYDDHERSSQDGDARTYTNDFSTTGEMIHGSQSNGFARSRDNTFRADSARYGNSMDSRTDSSNLRTTTWDLSSGTEGQNKAEWNAHSTWHQGRSDNVDNSQGHINSTSSSTDRRIFYDSSVPDENGTYTRVEVDPETGKTTVYTRRVYSSRWPENWDRRFYREVSDSSPQNEDEQIRHQRDLRRIKREKEFIIKPQAVTDTQTGKTMQVVNLRCDGDVPTAKCFVFRCNIRNLGARQSASIRIKSRLWNSTLVEDYPRVSYVSIKSRASLILPEDIREDQDQSDDSASAETLAYPDLLDQLPPEEVPLWVILVSIFAGLLVLIIIVLIMWKLGFFERKRPDPTLSGNLDKDANGY